MINHMLLTLPDLSEQAAKDYLDYRKRRKNPLTETAWKQIGKEIAISGWSADDALAEAMNREWRGLKAIWLKRVEHEEMRQLQEIKSAPDRRGFIEKHTDRSWREGIDKRGFIEKHTDMSWMDDL